MQNSYPQLVTQLLFKRFGKAVNVPDLIAMGLSSQFKKTSQTADVARRIIGLKRVNNALALFIFDKDGLTPPNSYREALKQGFPVYRQQHPCPSGHQNPIMSAGARRCLLCVADELKKTRITKASKTLSSFCKKDPQDIEKILSLSDKEKADLLTSYLSEPRLASEFLDRAERYDMFRETAGKE